MTEEQQRAFTRVFFDAETIVSQPGRDFIVQLVDLSLRGALVQLLPDQTLNDDEPVDVVIHLGGDVQICMVTHVANHRGDHVGLAFDYIDVDSMTHLRRLVELNTGDTSLLERELHLMS